MGPEQINKSKRRDPASLPVKLTGTKSDSRGKETNMPKIKASQLAETSSFFRVHY